MIAEWGQYALILAFCFALVQSISPFYGAWRKQRIYYDMAFVASIAQLFFIFLSFCALSYAFWVNDFSVVYVAGHSHTDLPLMYRLSAVWGGHEGSLLLWVLMLAGWGGALTLLTKQIPRETRALLIGVMGLICIGFLAFIIFTSNPFLRSLPIAPFEGLDLNPLLQDPALIIHPPLLYMGYVGFSVAFAFAITGLITGQVDAKWARWARPWTLMAWSFLTLGIMLGSWWAYYVLGWGGWWFWDPVENASFMPWLLGTALIHCLAVVEKRNTFKRWTILLAICTFSLCLLGTFLVRSGILTSVHAFANDPQRGFYILMFLSIVIGASLLLYAWRSHKIDSQAAFQVISRETLLLINNLFLVLACATVFIGTLYPLFLDVLGFGKISVGPPYFNSVFVPMMLALFIFMGLGPASQWRGLSVRDLWSRVGLALTAAFALAWLLPWLITGQFMLSVVATVFLGVWIVLALLQDLRFRLKQGERLRTLSASYYAMALAHIGVAFCLMGVGLSKQFEVERDVYMQVGDTAQAGPYDFTLVALDEGQGPNYTMTIGTVHAFKDKQFITTLYPEKRLYTARAMPQSETDIHPGFLRDLYVALGEPLGAAQWSVRIYYKPFVRWIWLGALLMALGGIVGVFDARYRQSKARAYV